jgi:hypothetical protein
MDVLYIDNFLSDEVLKECQDYIDKFRGQTIELDVKFTNFFWDENKEKIQSIDPKWVGVHPQITKTNNNTPTKKHLDKKLRKEKHKMFIYLNEIPNGGTIFFESGEEYLVENKLNRLVIFNMDLYHEGQGFDPNQNINKKLIGFRLKE